MVRELDGTTRVVGVFGWPVGHSLSPPMHNAAFAELGLNWVYVPFEVRPDDLAKAVSGVGALGLAGVNVTIPHKGGVAGLVDHLDPFAAALQAVNTVVVADDGLHGYNTDGPGFVASMAEKGWSPGGRQVAIVGAGGSARSVAASMVYGDAVSVTIVNRTAEKASALAELVRPLCVGCACRVEACGLDEQAARDAVTRADIVVDCTSVGMHPHTDVEPVVPAEWLHPGQLVCDLTYNPRETVLLTAAAARGAETLEGAGMLVHQGAIAFEHWTGVPAPVETMRSALLAALERRD
ncbi:MAG TPA: shikimate dehydrogenase [Armatimonadetes bacterium]|nr:shikimate dehydrogenase [Armatimonadota bacterium]